MVVGPGAYDENFLEVATANPRGNGRGEILVSSYGACLDMLEEQLRMRSKVLLLTPLISTLMAAPLVAVLFVNDVRYFAVYPLTFLVLLGALLCAVAVERRRLRGERDSIRDRIRQIEVAP